MIDRALHAPFRLANLDELRRLIEQLGLDLAVEEDISILARPIEIAGRTIPNSMATQPMEGCDAALDGAPGELTFRRYRRFGAGGAGLLWFEACAVAPDARANPRQLRIHKGNRDNFARLLDAATEAAAESMGPNHRPFAVLQLTHSGRYTQPAPVIACHDPYLDPTRNIPPDQPVISDGELEALEDAYVEAAKLAFQAGFDAVDIKSCHRYLINELLAAHTREGKYGGTYENRTRFLKNVVGKIRAELGGDRIVTCRLNIYDAHPYPYGWGMDRESADSPDLNEPKRLIQELSEMGMPLVNITMGNPYYSPHVNRPYDTPVEDGRVPEEHPLVGVARLVGLTRQVRPHPVGAGVLPHQQELPHQQGARQKRMAVVGSGYSWLRNLWPHIAAAEIGSGAIQLVGLGRQAFAYPGFAKEIIETGKLDRRHTCITCSGCTQIMRDGGMSGCVPFDSEVYGPIFRKGRRMSLEYIMAQASRCRDCFDPRCKDGCPAGVDIPGFVRALADGDIKRSYEILRERNALPELCGYVCPVEVQCRGHCIENVFSGNPVPIGEVQVYVARTAREKGWISIPTDVPATGKRIAVIGAGPPGLACAVTLLRRGHAIDLFDHEADLGGLATSAIPEKRLQADESEAEIKAVFGDVWGRRLDYHTDRALSHDRALDDLLCEYDAVFLGIGLAECPSIAEVRPPGVEDAIAFLKYARAGEATVPERVAVLGGGNTAMDAAVQAASLGARDVYLVYRRSFAEMPAWPAERDEALNLGVHFLLLTHPLGYEFDDQGKLRGTRIARTVLGEPDSSGRRRPVIVPGSESVLEVDLVLEALGQEMPAGMEALLPEVELTADRLIKIDERGRTSRPGVYAGGDIVNGGSTVVQAVAEGMRAAEAIDADLRTD